MQGAEAQPGGGNGRGHGLGRIQLSIPLREWLEKAAAPPILVAIARVLGATLLTNDRHILDSGLVATLS